MGLISLLFKDPATFILLVPLLLYSVIAHEVAHGWAAYLCGDDTAKRSGRLSLNPIVHVDPMGTLALFLVGFGWAKPVPVNYFRLNNFRWGLVFVSIAGCLMNIAIATMAIFLLQTKLVAPHSFLASGLFILAQINIVLGALNLIPIPPLDGSKILMAFLPKATQRSLSRIEPYGFFVLIILIMVGMLKPLINFVQTIILQFIGLILNF